MLLHKSTSLITSSPPRVEQRDFGKVCVFDGCLSKGEPDSDLDLVEPSAWDGVAKAESTLLLWMHDLRQPIGSWAKMERRADGLYGTGEINMEFDLGKQAAALVRQPGGVSGISVGFKPNKASMVEKEMDVAGRGRKKVRVISKIERLYEASVVSIPACDGARIAKGAQMLLASGYLTDLGIPSRAVAEFLAKWAKDDDEPEDEMQLKGADGRYVDPAEFENFMKRCGLDSSAAAQLGVAFKSLSAPADDGMSAVHKSLDALLAKSKPQG